MSDNYIKLLHIDNDIVNFIDEHKELKDKELDKLFEKTDYIEKAIKIIEHTSNNDILEIMINSEYLCYFIDFKVYLKEYHVNKTHLEETKEYKEELDKLDRIGSTLFSKFSKEFQELEAILKLNNAYETIYKLMPNEMLSELANKSTDWMEKLYYYSFFKTNK